VQANIHSIDELKALLINIRSNLKNLIVHGVIQPFELQRCRQNQLIGNELKQDQFRRRSGLLSWIYGH